MKLFSNLLAKISKWLKSMPERTMLIIVAFVVGLLSGLAAVILKSLIHLIQNSLLSWSSPEVSTYLYLLLPGIGMLISMLLVKYLVKDDVGHGVTKVLLAVSRNESRIKRRHTWSSILTSSVTIGFGGSVGAEAPIVFTGAALGSNVARVLGLSYKQMTMLLGCGAAGAVAGIFKAPLAGVLFTLEILLFNISMTAILPLLVSTITATVTSYIFFGMDVAFAATIEKFALSNLPYYIILGIFCGLVSLYFMKTTLSMEDRIKRIKKPFMRWGISAFFLGIILFLFPPLYGEGYGNLTDLLNNNIESAVSHPFYYELLSSEWSIPIFFFLVMIFKVVAMSFTNAGGGVGGTFGPTLFVGGIAGFIVARVINIIGIHPLPETNFVLVGMGGLMAGVMQAPLTAIFLIAEITGGYELLMPLIITSTISFATIRGVESYSIYTKRIANQGDLLTHDSDKAVLTLLKTSQMVERDFIPINVSGNLADLVAAIRQSNRSIFPVVDSKNKFQGVIYLNDIRSIMFDRSLYDSIKIESLMKNAPTVVLMDEKMDSVMNKFEVSEAWNLPVIDINGEYQGFVSRSKIFSYYREQLQQVSHD
ncbi:MAG: chloride channel protein [Bacteroidales bacterium]|nr:chloride channel protein [Bacteroidales bacterium]